GNLSIPCTAKGGKTKYALFPEPVWKSDLNRMQEIARTFCGKAAGRERKNRSTSFPISAIIETRDAGPSSPYVPPAVSSVRAPGPGRELYAGARFRASDGHDRR